MTMKYQPSRFTMWDAWCIQKEDEVHMFHLQFPKAGTGVDVVTAPWGHAVSRDLLHWQEKPNVLPPRGLPHDGEIKFTGCTVEKDGTYYMFYVMREGAYQRIGLALSNDLYNWQEYEGNPVLTPDPKWFNGYAEGEINRCTLPCWEPNVDCRDMVVRPDGKGGWYGYFVAAADLGGYSPVGVIGVAHSEDLFHWEQRGIAFKPRWTGIVEMMDIFELEGRYYMTLLTASSYGSRHCFSDENVCKGEIYAVSDSPEGPFVEDPADNTFIGGPVDSGYSCRTLDFGGAKRVLYIDPNGSAESKGVLSFPKTVRAENGKLRPCYAADLMASLRLRALDTAITRLPQNSFAWPSRGGAWQDGEVKKAQTAPESWQACLFADNTPARNAEIEGEFTWDCHSFGFVFWGEGEDNQKLAVVAEPGKNRLYVTQPYAWELHNFRSYDFGGKNSAHIRVLLADDTVEVYVNDELVVNCGCPNPGGCLPGLFADGGTLQVKNVKAWEIGL